MRTYTGQLLFLLTIHLFFGTLVYSQDRSDANDILLMDDDSNKVNALNDLSWKLLFSHRDSAESYINEAINLSGEIAFDRGKAKALKCKGILMDMRGSSAKAIEYWMEGQKIYRKLGNIKEEANILNNIGMAHFNLGSLGSSQLNYDQSLKLARNIGYKKGEARALNNIARIYDLKGEFVDAMGYYLQALEINRELENELALSKNLNNLGIIHQEVKNYPSALEYYNESLGIKRKLNREKEVGITLNNIGYIHFIEERYDSALVYFNEALDLQAKLNARSEVAWIKCNMSRVHFQKNEFEKALPLIEESIEIRKELGEQGNIIYANIILGEILSGLNRKSEAIEILEGARKASIQDSIIFNIIDADDALAILYDGIGDHQKAYARLQESEQLEDLSYDQEEFSKILQKHSDHYQEIADAELERDAAIIEKNNAQRKFFIGAMIAAILAALGLLNRYRYVRKNRNIIAAEKRRSDDLLLNILPEKTAEELKENGTAKALRFDQVSVLFTDFKGFTAASGVMDPTKLVDILHGCFSAFDDIVGKYNIEKIKTIGDAYMCVSGLPKENPDHARDLVLAGLEFQAYVESRKGDDFPFTMRLGINTGSVVAGIVGKKKFAYDIWGDAVNIAARMESNGEIGRVNVSETTYQMIKDEFDCEPRGAIEAKGKGKLNMYFVNQPKNELIEMLALDQFKEKH
ncbi:MAG: tetratricopeptide repeat protein [Flavobacteriales bacterium]|nr:tetratricopeptide repeat protein [Flavobacteriales bacterium]